MFPEVQENTIRHLRVEQNMSTNDVIHILVSQQEKCKTPTVQSILARHCQQNINVDDEYLLKTDIACGKKHKFSTNALFLHHQCS